MTPNREAPDTALATDEEIERLISRLRNFTAPRIAGMLMDEAADMIARLSAAKRRAPDAVAVKPLEWIEMVAETAFGSYWMLAGIDAAIRLGSSMPWNVVGRYIKFATEDEAKAFAQADYEQRILSALAPSAPEDRKP